MDIDGRRYHTDTRWGSEAPYRAVTVRDAISDLPRIKNRATRPRLKYASEPVTHFQKVLRQESAELVMDRITKNVSPLDLARIQHIPKVPGADWRDPLTFPGSWRGSQVCSGVVWRMLHTGMDQQGTVWYRKYMELEWRE